MYRDAGAVERVDMLQDNLVSVVIPAFNAERTLGATLDSVSRQSHGALEIVVVDDGSTDDTVALAHRHAETDPRIRVISVPNGGVSKARNAGIAATSGLFVATVDADDIWHPDKITLQMRAMAQGGKDVGFVYCFSRRIDAEGRAVGVLKTHPLEGHIFLRSLVFNPVGNGSSMLARRSAVEEAGGFHPDPEVQEDNLLQILISRSWRVALVPLCLTGYRVNESSRSSDLERAGRGRIKVLRYAAERFPEVPSFVLSLAEGRLRAILATQAFDQKRVGRGLRELCLACRSAPICALEYAAVHLISRLKSRLRPRRQFGLIEPRRPGPDFFDCNPASGIGRPPRPLEACRLAALGHNEEDFSKRPPSAPSPLYGQFEATARKRL